MVIVIVALAGLFLGSLVNALVSRLAMPRDESMRTWSSFAYGRSMCEHCRHPLAPWDLVPVISYALLRGRCRYCGGPIPDGPAVELAMPLVFVLSYLAWPVSLSGFGVLLFSSWLALCACLVGLVAYHFRRPAAR